MNIVLESYVGKIGTMEEELPEPKFQAISLESHVNPIVSEVSYTTNAKQETVVLDTYMNALDTSVSVSKGKSVNASSYIERIFSSAKNSLEEKNIGTIELSSGVAKIDSVTSISTYRFPVTYDAHIYYMENETNMYHIENPSTIEVIK
ncbi:hypothetical protein ACUL41_06990 [Virgibacillus natechei]